MGAQWAEGAVTYNLKYGLSVTGLYPSVIIDDGGDLKRIVNWHHPATYWLYLTVPASLFGNSPTVLRMAHLALWMPAVWALRELVIVRVGAAWANRAALLFATTPVVAYYGPMVVQTGAVYSLGLIALWRFDVWISRPGRWRAGSAISVFFVLCLMDFPACWWGLAVAVLGMGAASWSRYILCVGSMAAAGLSAVAIVVGHFGAEFGGVAAYLGMLLDLGGEGDVVVGWRRIVMAVQRILLDHGCLPVVLLCVAGLINVMRMGKGLRSNIAILALSLVLPGVLDCVSLPNHAVDHVFWPIQAFSAVALLAAGVGGGGRAGVIPSNGQRIGSAAVCAVAVIGCIWTHVLVERYAAPLEPQRHRIERVAPLLERCTWSYTNLPKTTQVYYGGSWLIAGIDSPESFAAVRHVARMQAADMQLAFVLDRATASPGLVAALQGCGSPVIHGDLEVYRFRP